MFTRYPRLPGGVFRVDWPCTTNVRRLDNNILPVLGKMTKNGILIDPERFDRLEEELTEKLEIIETELACETGKRVNYNSPFQVSDLLYKDLGLRVPDANGRMVLPPMVYGGKCYSTDDEYLSRMAGHPVIDLIGDYREYSKLLGTYVRGIRAKADYDLRVRCRWLYTNVVTGRLASANPNMQNWPARNPEWGEKIRGAFIPAPGCKLVSHDLSQIEMRIGAEMSGDTRLIHAFHAGLDTHTVTAAYVFYPELALTDLPAAMSKVDKKTQRAPCKTVNFGIFYGQTAEGLQATLFGMGLVVTIDWCQWLINEWYRLYAGVSDYINECHLRARFYGMVWDMFGRHRLVPETRSSIKSVISGGLRQAGNMPIQSGAGGVLKIGMYVLNQLYDLYTDAGYVCRPLLQIHDEIVSEVTADLAEEFAYAGQQALATSVPLSVPIECGMEIGDDWGQLK